MTKLFFKGVELREIIISTIPNLIFRPNVKILITILNNISIVWNICLIKSKLNSQMFAFAKPLYILDISYCVSN